MPIISNMADGVNEDLLKFTLVHGKTNLLLPVGKLVAPELSPDQKWPYHVAFRLKEVPS